MIEKTKKAVSVSLRVCAILGRLGLLLTSLAVGGSVENSLGD